MTTKVMKLGPGTLKLGEGGLTDFSHQVTKCSLVPSVSKSAPVPVLSGGVVPGKRTETASLKGEFFQDLGESGSLVEWCWAHKGEALAFEFIPASAKGKAIKGTLVVEPVEIGGEVGEDVRTSFEFECVGMPTISEA